MDLNLVVLAGRLATAPELRTHSGGATHLRCLVTARSERPRRRVDVVPVVWWNPDEALGRGPAGTRVWVAGSVQRRFWDEREGRRSRLEVVAHEVQVVDGRDDEAAER